MLDSAKISLTKKKVNKRNKPYWDEELTELQKERKILRSKGVSKLEEWNDKNKELNARVKENKSKFWKGFVKELKNKKMLVKYGRQ